MFYFFKKFLLFITVPVLPVLFLASFDHKDRMTNHDINILKLANMKQFDSLDILFTGSSFCYSGVFNPYFDSLGYKTFNLGTAAAGPYFYQIIIDDYLRNVKKQPALIMMSIAPNTFSSISDNFLAYPVHRYINDPLSNEKIATGYNYLAEYPEMEMKSVSKGISNLLNRHSYTSHTTDTGVLANKGFFKSYAVFNPANEKEEAKTYAHIKFDKFDYQKLEHLKSFARSLKERNIQVAFFEIPTYKLRTFFNEKYLAAFEKSKTELQSEFIYFTDDSNLPLSCFRSIDHINTQGAMIYTPMLEKKIMGSQLGAFLKKH